MPSVCPCLESVMSTFMPDTAAWPCHSCSCCCCCRCCSCYCGCCCCCWCCWLVLCLSCHLSVSARVFPGSWEEQGRGPSISQSCESSNIVALLSVAAFFKRRQGVPTLHPHPQCVCVSVRLCVCVIVRTMGSLVCHCKLYG